MRKWIPVICLGAVLLIVSSVAVWYPYKLYTDNAKNGDYYSATLETAKALYADFIARGDRPESDDIPLHITTRDSNGRAVETLHLGTYFIQRHLFEYDKDINYLLSFPDYLAYVRWLKKEAGQYKSVVKYLGEASNAKDSTD